MFDRYMICPDGFTNVVENGAIIGFQIRVRITYYRGIALSLVEGFDVSVDGRKYSREQVRFSVKGQTFSFAEMAKTTEERWNFGEPATLTIPEPGGLAPGSHEIEVLEHLRISYLPWPSVTADRKVLTLASSRPQKDAGPSASKIKLGVSLYSFQEEYFLGKMTLEDCIAAASNLGAEGIEILGEQMIPNFPSPDAKFMSQWFSWMEKYGVTPTAYDGFLDTKLHKDRLLDEQECVEMMERDIKLASQLGFKVLRTLVMTPRAVIEKSLPIAERHDVKIGIEIHAPFSLKSAWFNDFQEFAEKAQSPYFGIVPDMGIFVRRLPPVYLGWHVRHGATPAIVDYIAQAYASGVEKEAAKAEVARLGGSETDLRLCEQAFHYSCDELEWLRPQLARSVHIHAKFYEMTPECVEPSIPYNEIMPILVEGGFNGYLSSEYEGQRHIQDLGEVDSVEQVRRQHRMFRKLLGE